MKKALIAIACVAALACACQQNAAPKANEMKKNGDMQKPRDQGPCCKPKEQTPCCKPKPRCCEAEKTDAPKEGQTVKAESAPESQTVSTPEVKVEMKQ